MTRRADISRTTGETNIELALALDGSGEGRRSTGVGFFDHLLDALARHGRLDLDVRAQGDLETGAHHTVEDTGIVLGQALDEALGDRAGIQRFGQATVPMDEARASCAIDVSGRPFCVVRGRAARRRDPGLRDRPRRGVPARGREQREAHAARADRGGDQRPPHGRGGLQGVRAGAARGGGARPDRDRRPVHEGRAVTRRIAILDYGMGNLRSVEKALEHVGAEAEITRDHERVRAAGRGRAARRRRVPEGDGGGAPARLRRPAARARRRRAGPCSGSAWGCSCCSRARPSSAEAEGIGLLEGPVEQLDANGLKVPHIGWNPVAWRADSGAERRAARPDGLLPRALVRAAARRRATCSGSRPTGASSSAPWPDRRSTASSSTRRSPGPTGFGC